MKYRKILIILFIFTCQKFFSNVSVAKDTLSDKKMKGAIISLKIFHSVYNVGSNELLNTFKENVEKFPINELEKEIMAQNENLSLVSYNDIKEILPEYNDKKINVEERSVFNGYTAAYDKYSILSEDSLERYYNFQGFTVSEKYSKKILKSYFDLLDVDTILLVKVNIDSNYQGITSDQIASYYIYTRPFYTARIMIVALNKNFELVGYNSNYRYKKKELNSYLNVFVGSKIYKMDLEYGYWRKSKYYIFKEIEEAEISKMDYFFKEFYNSSFKPQGYLGIEDLLQTNAFISVTMNMDLDLNISYDKKEMVNYYSDINDYFKLIL